MNKLGIYIHVPFCERKCAYCDFYSINDKTLSSAYTKRLIEDIYEKSKITGEYTVDTVYFGGGTPSLLSCDDFSDIMSAVYSAFNVEKNAEMTIEVNPASVDTRRAYTYVSCGINRVSIGMQTRNEAELAELGRIHKNRDFDETYRILRNSGVTNMSVDIMYALPFQTLGSLSETIDYVVSVPFEHISTYCLKLERGTPMYERAPKLPNEDIQYAMYEMIDKRLADAGYEHYEISNFAKKGFESKHNVKYWQMGEYLGFGPSAYSYFGGKRYGFERDLTGYLSGSIKETDVDIIDQSTYEFERVMLGLRLAGGVPLSLVDSAKAQKLSEQGLGMIKNGRFSLTTRGFFVSNEIICYLTD